MVFADRTFSIPLMILHKYGQISHRCDVHCALNCDLSSDTPPPAARRDHGSHMMSLLGCRG